MARKSTKTTTKTVKTPIRELPPDVREADTKWPAIGKSLPHEERVKLGLGYESTWAGSFTFYFIPDGRKAPAWVLTTLDISKGKRGQPDRSYGIGVTDSKVYTVGNGPHVVATVTVSLRGQRGEAGQVHRPVEEGDGRRLLHPQPHLQPPGPRSAVPG